jgi:hypothetical protein
MPRSHVPTRTERQICSSPTEVIVLKGTRISEPLKPPQVVLACCPWRTERWDKDDLIWPGPAHQVLENDPPHAEIAVSTRQGEAVSAARRDTNGCVAGSPHTSQPGGPNRSDGTDVNRASDTSTAQSSTAS